jgi:predicted transcriptional regulator
MSAFDERTAADIMRRELIVVRPDQPLSEARHLLIESHISGAPVVDEGRLVGIVSRSDLVRVEELVETLDSEVSGEVWQERQTDGFRHQRPEGFHGFSRRLGDLRVRDAMRAQVICCDPDTAVREVAAEMVRHHVHRIVVVENGAPVGIVSTLDIAALVARGP